MHHPVGFGESADGGREQAMQTPKQGTEKQATEQGTKPAAEKGGEAQKAGGAQEVGAAATEMTARAKGAQERTKEAAAQAKDRAMHLERRAEEKMEAAARRVVDALRGRPGLTSVAVGGAAFALASAIGAAEVAVAAGGAYAAYRWLSSSPSKQTGQRTEQRTAS
jgi:hypothetical protein